MLKLTLNQMAMTCSNVTKIDGSDVQQMSQMADLNGSDSVGMSPAVAAVVAPASFGILVWDFGYISRKCVLQVGKC
jgi:hypothetical protein